MPPTIPNIEPAMLLLGLYNQRSVFQGKKRRWKPTSGPSIAANIPIRGVKVPRICSHNALGDGLVKYV